MQESIGKPTNDFLSGGGEMGALMRSFDFSTTPLGPACEWPQSLRSAVSICLNSRFPIVLYWGPQFISLYNDAYIPILGSKHSWALGQPFEVVWADIWDVLGPVLRAVFETGVPSWAEDQQLIFQRSGYLEEVYFTFSFGAGRNERGDVGGIFCAVTETTQRVLHERRLAILKELSAEARTTPEAARIMAEVLEHTPDIPFALLYLKETDGLHAGLASHCGLPEHSTVAPVRIDLTGEQEPWRLSCAQSDGMVVLTDLERCFGPLPGRPWPESATSAAVIPLKKAGQSDAAGYLILGISPRRAFDEAYRRFFELVGNHVATMVSNARAYEDERRRAEALAELDRAKTTFFSNVSHEFRTPLTLMLDPLVEALHDPVSGSNPVHKERLEFAYRNSRRLLKLVNSLLDFSRIEGGRIEASYEPTDLATVTSELAGVFRAAMEQARLTLHVNCPPLSEPVYVDRDMWEKIVLNLLSNAFKFTFEGGVTVSVHEEMAPAHTVILEVRDTGTGIPQDQLGRIFERFHRVQGARGRTIEGTGIGLALVKELVQLHGGTIEAVSQPNRGSVFTVKIPFGTAHLPQDHLRGPRLLASTATRSDVFVEEALRWLPFSEEHDVATRVEQASQEMIADISPSLPILHPRLRVLVVDDNADMRGYLGRLLSEVYQVETVSNGRVALERVDQDPPDLVLTDVMMPDVDGFALLRELRRRPHTKTLPVILLSARAGEESRIEGLERGADDYLIKPFSAKELLARVAAHLEIARVRREAERVLLHQSRQFETLLNQAPFGVYLVDAEFRISQVNPVALPVFGEIPDLIGRELDEVLHILWEKAYADEVMTCFRHTLDTGKSYIAPERVERRLDRDAIESYEWRIDRIVLSDGRFGVVCYFRDVSVQVLAREALRRSEERLREFALQLEQLVGERTQELVQSQVRLRALTTELNLAEQRERKRLAAELHDHLQQMLVLGKLKLGQGMRLPQAAPRAVDIMKQTDDVLSEALQYTRTLVAELSPPVLHEHGLAAGLLWLATQMKRHDLTVAVRVPETQISLPEDQAVLLFQSVRELLINASKHAHSHEANVKLELTDGNLRISVEDNGVGFDAAVPPGDAPSGALSSKFGLFSIRERMKALGGTLEIRSSQGQGTTAMLSLPVGTDSLAASKIINGAPGRRQDTTVTIERVSDPSASGSPQSSFLQKSAKIRVLLVDDHAMVREGLRSVLESYDDVEIVGEASNGEDALQLVERFRPALVVMDINMPGMNGIDATAFITRTFPEVAVIGLSVNATGSNVQAMLKAGAVLLLTKEAAVNELYRRMREVLMAHVGSGSAAG